MNYADYLRMIGIITVGFVGVMALIWAFLLLAPGDVLFAKDAWAGVAILYLAGGIGWGAAVLIYRYRNHPEWPLLATVVYGLLCFFAIAQLESVGQSCFFDHYGGTVFLGNEIINEMEYACPW